MGAAECSRVVEGEGPGDGRFSNVESQALRSLPGLRKVYPRDRTQR